MILVVGSTGDLGGQITRELLAHGRPVRILVRPGSDHRAVLAAGAQPATGDLKDAASLATACAGVHTVITTANAAARTGADTVESVDLHGNLALIQAAETAGVHRFVFTSALGAHPGHPMALLRAKGATELRLHDSPMVWTVLRPNVLMDKIIPIVVGALALSNQPVTLIGNGASRHSFVAMRDVTAYALTALENPLSERRTLTIAGPEAISWRDIVTAFENELGRAIPVHTVAPGEPAAGLPDFVSRLLTTLETYDSPIDMTQTSADYGITPTPLADYVRDFIATADSQSTDRPREVTSESP